MVRKLCSKRFDSRASSRRHDRDWAEIVEEGNTLLDNFAPKLSAPVVLVHGLCGFTRLFSRRRQVVEYFPGIRPFLESAGNRVLMPRVSPTAGIATRAKQLKDYLQREVGQQPVHLLGHSLGGLDSRYMISRLGMDKQVLSLTTIGTPHRGTTFADWSVSRLERYYRPLFRSMGIAYDGIRDLTTEACARFNEETPDAPTVRYQSIAGLCEKPWLPLCWKFPAAIVHRAEGPNDGIVSVASATWGTQTEIWNGDHLNLVNWPNKRLRKAGQWQDRTLNYGRVLEQVGTIANAQAVIR
jgi:triacylglycerol lipase